MLQEDARSWCVGLRAWGLGFGVCKVVESRNPKP